VAQHDWSNFDPKQWAMGHEDLCGQRFASVEKALAAISRVLWAGLTILLAITGWSLKANYDNAQAQIRAVQQASSTIQTQVGSQKPPNTTILVH
jgi:hypothetical protein